MRNIVLLSALVTLMAMDAAQAGVRTIGGLWVDTQADTSFWLKLEATSADPGRLIEDVTGTLSTRTVGASTPTTSEVPVVGQYLTRTGIIILNIGEVGAKRFYAIGDTRAEHSRSINLRVFRVRPAQGINFERELWLDYRSKPQPPTAD